MCGAVVEESIIKRELEGLRSLKVAIFLVLRFSGDHNGDVLRVPPPLMD